ncbi:MAG TPA: FliH/SctL family protein [Noviherbaspirillum sp.]|nr:FliH/SctL family protein [Noviherbaspirillum sp.]
MSSSVIPKEKLSAYERWELASFGDAPAPAPVDHAALAAQHEQALAEERAQARKQGHDEGFEQGRKAGLAAGRAEAAREAACLRQVVEAFSNDLNRANEQVADDLLHLSLDLAKAMLKTALKVRPELVLPVVAESIRYLPSVQQPALLVLHPADAELVRAHLTDELDKAGWRIAEDAQMERGGCRVETASNQIEAGAPVRWQRIAEALGKQSDWLE